MKSPVPDTGDKITNELLLVAYNDGLATGRKEVLDFLQAKYIADEGRPERGSPEGDAILEVAKEAAIHIRGLK